MVAVSTSGLTIKARPAFMTRDTQKETKMENNDKARALWLDLYAWAKINVFCAGILFISGWAIGVYKIDVNTYQTASADEVLSWELTQQTMHENKKVK